MAEVDQKLILWTVAWAGLAGALYALIVRPCLVRWGATDDEVTRAFPGQDLVPDGTRAATMAITIEACILMTWVHANTSSLLLAALMHASYTGALMAFFPATTFGQGLLWQALFATALWVTAMIAVRSPARRSPSSASGQPDAPILGGSA